MYIILYGVVDYYPIMKLFFWLLIPIWYWVSLPFQQTDNLKSTRWKSIYFERPSHKYNLLSTFGIIICVQFYDFSTISFSSCLAHFLSFHSVSVSLYMLSRSVTLSHWYMLTKKLAKHIELSSISYLPF